MYLGVVARPRKDKGFDGRVLMKRVSRLKKYKRSTRNKQFHDDELTNRLIVSGAWKDLYRDLQDVHEDMTVADLFLALSDFYELRDEVAECLQLCQFVGAQKRERC